MAKSRKSGMNRRRRKTRKNRKNKKNRKTARSRKYRKTSRKTKGGGNGDAPTGSRTHRLPISDSIMDSWPLPVEQYQKILCMLTDPNRWQEQRERMYEVALAELKAAQEQRAQQIGDEWEEIFEQEAEDAKNKRRLELEKHQLDQFVEASDLDDDSGEEDVEDDDDQAALREEDMKLLTEREPVPPHRPRLDSSLPPSAVDFPAEDQRSRLAQWWNPRT